MRFKPGDKIRIVADTCCHHYPIGTIATILEEAGYGDSEYFLTDLPEDLKPSGCYVRDKDIVSICSKKSL